jgi:putative transposase
MLLWHTACVCGGQERGRSSLPRCARVAPGGVVYHTLNRAVARSTLFKKDGDYEAFERVLGLALERCPIRLLAFCLMPTHWHLVLWPIEDGQLTSFTRWLTHTHTMRWHAHYGTAGTGHLYQGRFKAFPVQDDTHLLTVCRYVERNPVRAGLVARAEQWRWSSLWWAQQARQLGTPWLSEWPVPRPEPWAEIVNEPLTAAELAAVRRSARRGTPYGSDGWRAAIARQLNLESTLRALGRPRKRPPEK